MKRFIGMAAAAAGGYWLATRIESSRRNDRADHQAPDGPRPVRRASIPNADMSEPAPAPTDTPVEGVDRASVPRPTVGPAGRRWEPSGTDEQHPLAVLYREHRALLSAVAAVRRADPEKPNDAKELHAAVQRMITDASRHEFAEESHIWPLVRSRLPDGEAVAAAACSEELEMKRILRALETRRPGDIDFAELLANFESQLRHHVDSEESRVWPILEAVLTTNEADVLSDELKLSEAAAPTRPHPSELADPAKHPVLSKAAGLVDRGVDAVAGRGRGPYSGQ
jgi:hemerythrin-like domain-containing protein